MSIVSFVKNTSRKVLPKAIVCGLRARESILNNVKDNFIGLGVYWNGFDGVDPKKSRKILSDFEVISQNVSCEHTQKEMLEIASAIISSSELAGEVVECGTWRGGSTCKISKVAGLVGKRLIAFDSFEGIPDNEEGAARLARNNREVNFEKGDYAASIDEVRSNLRKFGDYKNTKLVKGYFDDTLPKFNKKISVAYLDVDLVESTKTCLEHLWPLLVEGGGGNFFPGWSLS